MLHWNTMFSTSMLKPGFHIVVSVVSVVSVVRKKFIGQLQIYGNLPYKCSIQKKRQIQLFVRDRMNSICPMNFFSYDRHDRYDRYNDMETNQALFSSLKQKINPSSSIWKYFISMFLLDMKYFPAINEINP